MLNECATVTNVVYIQGNHDFHLSGLFSSRIAVAESWETMCGDRRMRWEHGDLIGVGAGYRRLRAFLRSQLVRRVTEGFPPWLAWRLALRWSETSRDASPDTTEADMLALLPEVLERFATADILVTGHYHLPYSHKFEHGKEWWGLGPWLNDCWYLETIDGQSTLRQAGA
jgi:UDP-2,3-diacylglucosamine pyrophosphatase LpxH